MPLVALSAATLTLASVSTFAATVYKWTDERGVVHYSDQPHPEAKEMDVKPAPPISSVPPTASATPAPPNANAAPAGPIYSLCEIWRPEPDEVFLNTATMTARIRLEPQLQPGHTVSLSVDGRRVPDLPTTGTEFVISNLTRGTHTLLLLVEDAAYKRQCTSSPVTFHVRQPSVQAPNRANRPRF
jgi:hypothetical protein